MQFHRERELRLLLARRNSVSKLRTPRLESQLRFRVWVLFGCFAWEGNCLLSSARAVHTCNTRSTINETFGKYTLLRPTIYVRWCTVLQQERKCSKLREFEPILRSAGTFSEYFTRHSWHVLPIMPFFRGWNSLYHESLTDHFQLYMQQSNIDLSTQACSDPLQLLGFFPIPAQRRQLLLKFSWEKLDRMRPIWERRISRQIHTNLSNQYVHFLVIQSNPTPS